MKRYLLFAGDGIEPIGTALGFSLKEIETTIVDDFKEANMEVKNKTIDMEHIIAFVSKPFLNSKEAEFGDIGRVEDCLIKHKKEGKIKNWQRMDLPEYTLFTGISHMYDMGNDFACIDEWGDQSEE